MPACKPSLPFNQEQICFSLQIQNKYPWKMPALHISLPRRNQYWGYYSSFCSQSISTLCWPQLYWSEPLLAFCSSHWFSPFLCKSNVLYSFFFPTWCVPCHCPFASKPVFQTSVILGGGEWPFWGHFGCFLTIPSHHSHFPIPSFFFFFYQLNCPSGDFSFPWTLKNNQGALLR